MPRFDRFSTDANQTREEVGDDAADWYAPTPVAEENAMGGWLRTMRPTGEGGEQTPHENMKSGDR